MKHYDVVGKVEAGLNVQAETEDEAEDAFRQWIESQAILPEPLIEYFQLSVEEVSDEEMEKRKLDGYLGPPGGRASAVETPKPASPPTKPKPRWPHNLGNRKKVR